MSMKLSKKEQDSANLFEVLMDDWCPPSSACLDLPVGSYMLTKDGWAPRHPLAYRGIPSYHLTSLEEIPSHLVRLAVNLKMAFNIPVSKLPHGTFNGRYKVLISDEEGRFSDWGDVHPVPGLNSNICLLFEDPPAENGRIHRFENSYGLTLYRPFYAIQLIEESEFELEPKFS